ncbi:hypothetical protein A1O1_07890 [Capronia coronata CBS 617.96]|uniref:Fungal N-terminal domain-containing protein n=1 Tax=Capronia coronata CBS 617.96 TaxID=1182541 RepID=W9XWU0_9EURO|nr:uncharacterized protein A1O1_07890 [Capronia coronata CBS 617.96]EXJ81825.1 hypothetical protein A1O1_07890 [Capronia coronata CBS 617.96]
MDRTLTVSGCEPQARSQSWTPTIEATDSTKEMYHRTPKRHSWPKIKPTRVDDDEGTLEDVHARRRVSLCNNIMQLSLKVGKDCTDINHRLDQMETAARHHAAEALSSLTRMSAIIRHELDNLRASAQGFEIPRLSSFWIQSWKTIYDIRQRILLVNDILFQLDADNKVPQKTCEDDYHEDRLEGFRLRAFVSEVEQAVVSYARTSKALRQVNQFALKLPKCKAPSTKL